MGAAIFVSLEKTIEGVSASSVDGKFLAKSQSKLDAICKKNGQKPLGAFISVNPDDLDGLPGLLTKLAQTKGQWFDCADGLKTVEFLLTYLEQHPSEIDHPQVIVDLRATRQVLEQAQGQETRFHLSVDF
jgi:hypothetical protein